MATLAPQNSDGLNLEPYLRPTAFLDSDHPAVIDFAEKAVAGAATPREKAIRLYYAVRDGFIYDPYDLRLTPQDFRASYIVERGKGFCVTKAGLLAAAGRAVGLPTRMGFGDVRNHLSTKKLLDLIGTDLFIFHGNTEFLLDGKWIKATPAFNLSLCQKFRVIPLEWDGVHDAIFHPKDEDGRRHMEYVVDRGWRDDLPFDEIVTAFRAAYPKLYEGPADGDFAAEAEAENAR